MIHRRAALGFIASAGAISASSFALAKEKHHLNGNALLGAKIKQNGKHKIHTAGKADVFAEVSNGKVVGGRHAGQKSENATEAGRVARPDPRRHASRAKGL